jgi:hypothetical protein
MADAPFPTVEGRVVVYTPDDLIEKSVQVFLPGHTDQDQKQASKTLEIEARQANGIVCDYFGTTIDSFERLFEHPNSWHPEEA